MKRLNESDSADFAMIPTLLADCIAGSGMSVGTSEPLRRGPAWQFSGMELNCVILFIQKEN